MQICTAIVRMAYLMTAKYTLERKPVKFHIRPCLSLLLLGLLVLAGCASSPSIDEAGGGGGGKKGGRGRGGGNNAAQPVDVAQAKLRDVPIEINVVGAVEAYKTISVKSQVSGILTNMYFNEGDMVKKDQKLFTVDPRPYQAQLAQAEANLKKDQAQLGQAEANMKRDTANQKYTHDSAERYARLLSDGVVSKDQAEQLSSQADALSQGISADQAAIDSVKAQILADQANIDNLKVQLGYTTVTAPLEGRTGNVSVKLGNLLAPNTVEVVTINQVQPIYVTFSVPESDLAEVKQYSASGHLPVLVKPQDGKDDVERGELTFIDNAVDTSTGTIKLKGTFQNPGLRLWPGQFLNVTLRLTTQPNAVTVPNEAVQNGQSGQFVYVVKDDHTVEARDVTTGTRIDEDLVITKGLQAGETVVTNGQLRLQPGSLVTTNPGRGFGGGGGRGQGQAAPGGPGAPGGPEGRGGGQGGPGGGRKGGGRPGSN